jgi:GNAT superfamily N-acetyltransferase
LPGDAAGRDDLRMNAEPQLRRGTGKDAEATAELYVRARRHAVPHIPPLAHPDDEVQLWIRRVVDEQETWLAAADDGTTLGLMVLDDGWIEQLYMDPAWTGRGLGTRFVALAKQRMPHGLQLWTFVSNVRAQRFYERHGFTVEERTDGTGNEENAPDLRYVWRPSWATVNGSPGQRWPRSRLEKVAPGQHVQEGYERDKAEDGPRDLAERGQVAAGCQVDPHKHDC